MTGNMVSGAVAARAWDYIPIAREARMSMHRQQAVTLQP